MKNENKLIIGGGVAILIGVYLMYTSKDSTVIKNDVELPNEGGDIRRMYLGNLLASGGFMLFCYGVFKK